MKKKCTGTKNFEGCGELKIYSDDPATSEFSTGNKNMCKKCENKRRRERYHHIEHQEDKMYNELISMSWRKNEIIQ